LSRAFVFLVALVGFASCFYDWEKQDSGTGGGGAGGGGEGGDTPVGGAGMGGTPSGGGNGGGPMVVCDAQAEFACGAQCCRFAREACVLVHEGAVTMEACEPFDVAACDDGSPECADGCPPPDSSCQLCCRGDQPHFTFHCGEPIPSSCF
jgi:hypothetical protein